VSTQPEALRLAEMYADRLHDYRIRATEETLHDMMVFRDALEAELRRLHDELISSNTHAELTDQDCSRLEAENAALKEENERLDQINQSHEMKLSVRGYENQIADLKAEVEELRGALDEAMWHVKYKELKAVNEELLEALKQHVQLHDSDCICQNCAAIAKAGGAA
jgi:archaellum component FlaC